MLFYVDLVLMVKYICLVKRWEIGLIVKVIEMIELVIFVNLWNEEYFVLIVEFNNFLSLEIFFLGIWNDIEIELIMKLSYLLICIGV